MSRWAFRSCRNPSCSNKVYVETAVFCRPCWGATPTQLQDDYSAILTSPPSTHRTVAARETLDAILHLLSHAPK